jgi:hypothetical protein
MTKVQARACALHGSGAPLDGGADGLCLCRRGLEFGMG